MVRRIQLVVGLAATMLNVVAIVYFLRWLAGRDWIFGHWKGPATYIITAFWTSLSGVVVTLAWFTIALCRKVASRQSSTAEPTSRRLTFLQGTALVVLFLPTCLILRVAGAELPAAREKLQRDRIRSQIDRMKSGKASVSELIEGLESPESNVRIVAATALAKIGPRAKSAVPALAEALEDVGWRAAEALAAIGPAAEPAIPALIEALKREAKTHGNPQRSPLGRHVSQALAAIGPAALPALQELLTDENVLVRRCAPEPIRMMGPDARAALPTLVDALKDQDEPVRWRARQALEAIDPNWARTIQRR